ncbi:DUF1264-domain-containing protein [Nemania sp. NC0429]|nr:DUF1264-domain-containing protein [Nemania sp. NC0429]
MTSSTKPSKVPGDAVPAEDNVLETGASLIQNFEPTKQLCAHLNAFHAYADEPSRYVEANHYCAHLTEDIRGLVLRIDAFPYWDTKANAIKDVRQCLIYDSPGPNARIIGIEYMITPKLYEGLPAEERRLWHSHVYEVKSGMLTMPGPTAPGLQQAWEAAETREMRHVIGLYGKVYHLWQTDRGDALPLGEPKLMTSFTADGQLDFDEAVGERDRRFGTDWRRKKELRKDIEDPRIHEDADVAWKTKG